MTKETVADFAVIHAGGFMLSSRTENDGVDRRWRDFDLALPESTGLAEDRARLIIQFEIQPSERSRLRILVNAREISSADYNKSDPRLCQVIFAVGAAMPERRTPPPYPLRFAIDSGRLWLRDAVIWYQRPLGD